MRTSQKTTSETKLQGTRVIQTDDMSYAAGSSISLNSGPCFAPPKKQNNDLAGAIHIESNRVECIANKEAIIKLMKGLDSERPSAIQGCTMFVLEQLKNYQKVLFNQGMKLFEQGQKNLNYAQEISNALKGLVKNIKRKKKTS